MHVMFVNRLSQKIRTYWDVDIIYNKFYRYEFKEKNGDWHKLSKLKYYINYINLDKGVIK